MMKLTAKGTEEMIKILISILVVLTLTFVGVVNPVYADSENSMAEKIVFDVRVNNNLMNINLNEQ